MSKVKKRCITIISLFAALFLILGLGFGLPKISAFASDYLPSGIFFAGTNGEVGKSEIEGADTQYVQFTFSNADLSDGNNGGKVYYRRDLALKWYEKNKEENAATESSVQYFSMQFAFGDVKFEKFTIDFESAEENISKDGKTTNSIVFTKNADGTNLDVAVNEQESKVSVDKTGDVTIKFNEAGCQIPFILFLYAQYAHHLYGDLPQRE